ncbi:MAG: hypothetical protein LBU46_00900 [Candidatus Accumulibacter sp.]|jgi:hypothetical protein|nr:hypothetical protein [Accumulibacter sp.]
MQVSTLPASRGPRWLVEGFAIFRRKPVLLSFLVLGYLLSTAVISAVPLVGRLISFLLVPAFSVSMMNACRLIDKKEELPPQVLFSGFHRNLQTLIVLGFIWVLSVTAVFGLSSLIAGDAPASEALDMSASISAQLMVVLLIPAILAFWFAPVLAAWHDMSAGKSLFFSFVACLRNWRAFLLYSLAVAVMGAVISRLIGGLLGVGQNAEKLASVIVLVSLMLLPTLYASFYVSYRDIFVNMQDAS